ncbi:TPA: hypothetical protein JLJ54_003765 [Escherichia coli]|uniref:hypothetical protein n=1 Tax=Escherichia coli TaxID=562 RepID=UPI000B942191|nr:hypothetical protein [Escherichia coli]EFD0582362.1 hypothetical protein [Escherichia coli]EFM2179407.1 hypothetical protein [Escherichia coli]EFM2195274.1 hypothetical protein [Escherichia coli]EFM2214796.1 hypothetical protein [Escherichia coli]EGB5539937.1 hypothetical protein [Escherichia coli]
MDFLTVVLKLFCCAVVLRWSASDKYDKSFSMLNVYFGAWLYAGWVGITCEPLQGLGLFIFPFIALWLADKKINLMLGASVLVVGYAIVFIHSYSGG